MSQPPDIDDGGPDLTDGVANAVVFQRLSTWEAQLVGAWEVVDDADILEEENSEAIVDDDIIGEVEQDGPPPLEQDPINLQIDLDIVVPSDEEYDLLYY